MLAWRHVTAGLLVFAVMVCAGCEGSTPDTNIQAFQTLDEIAEQRRKELEKIWVDTALAVLQTERPDLQVSPGTGFALNVSGDGISDTFDLAPASNTLNAQPERSYPILEEHLLTLLPRFDQKRLGAMNWEKARPMLRVMLVAGAEVASIQKQMGDFQLPEGQRIVGDLVSIPAVRWREGGTLTPVTRHAIAGWNVGLDEVRIAATENVRSRMNKDQFETTSFGNMGRVGRLKSGAEPAMILQPEFLDLVRSTWGTADDLALLVASRQDIRFAEAKKTALLDLIYPQWKQSIDMLETPLARRGLKLSSEGITLLDYNPPVRLTPASTQPINNLPTTPRNPATPASRPALPQLPTNPYIVR